MKKIKYVLIPLFCLILSINTYAASSDIFSYDIGDTEIEVAFDDNTMFTESQKQNIAEALVYGGNSDEHMQSRGLTCTLFGHKLTTETVSVTYHKRKATSPRCYVEYYSVDSCSRCDYINEELLSGVYVVCCPVD